MHTKATRCIENIFGVREFLDKDSSLLEKLVEMEFKLEEMEFLYSDKICNENNLAENTCKQLPHIMLTGHSGEDYIILIQGGAFETADQLERYLFL